MMELLRPVQNFLLQVMQWWMQAVAGKIVVLF